MILATIIELLLATLIILGLIFEEKIARLEQRLFNFLKRLIKEGRHG